MPPSQRLQPYQLSEHSMVSPPHQPNPLIGSQNDSIPIEERFVRDPTVSIQKNQKLLESAIDVARFGIAPKLVRRKIGRNTKKSARKENESSKGALNSSYISCRMQEVLTQKLKKLGNRNRGR